MKTFDQALMEQLVEKLRNEIQDKNGIISRLKHELDALRRNSSYCPTPLSVPELTKEMLDRIEARAERSFRRHKSSIRGQQIIPQDDFDWHIIHATREELAAAPKPHWPVPSAPAVPQWQPIETAPKLAGERVLILKDCGPGTLSSMSIAFWLDDDRWHLTETTGTAESYGYRVTHWMPLPAAPSPTEADALDVLPLLHGSQLTAIETDAVLIRLTPEQKAAYQAQGGAKWVRSMIDALIDRYDDIVRFDAE